MIYCTFGIRNVNKLDENNDDYEIVHVYFAYQSRKQLEFDEEDLYNCAYNRLPWLPDVEYSADGDDLFLISDNDKPSTKEEQAKYIFIDREGIMKFVHDV